MYKSQISGIDISLFRTSLHNYFLNSTTVDIFLYNILLKITARMSCVLDF